MTKPNNYIPINFSELSKDLASVNAIKNQRKELSERLKEASEFIEDKYGIAKSALAIVMREMAKDKKGRDAYETAYHLIEGLRSSE